MPWFLVSRQSQFWIELSLSPLVVNVYMNADVLCLLYSPENPIFLPFHHLSIIQHVHEMGTSLKIASSCSHDFHGLDSVHGPVLCIACKVDFKAGNTIIRFCQIVRQ